MSNFGGSSFTGFKGVNLRGSLTGSAFVRLELGNFAGTVSITEIDQPMAWNLPAKSGTLPISGTFAVQIPLISATTSVQSTIVTVPNIRAEDGLTVTNQTPLASAYGTTTTARILFSAVPGNGNITLSFVNMGAATGYTEHVFGFTAVR